MKRAKDIFLQQYIDKHKVLFLSLEPEPYEVMVTGEKNFECRKPSKFIIDRLIDKKTGEFKYYDAVLFTQGYGYHRPHFLALFDGFGTGYENDHVFSNGFTLQQRKEHYNIFLGNIIFKYPR